MASFNSVNTKLEALKLIHDPVKLLSLLFSKYGDIEEDYNLLYIDQLVYNKSSHYNILFKEFKYYNMDEENLKRYYFEDESKNRLPKLSEYYKNYHMFFCKPILKNFQFGEILHNNDDNKAEIFYKKNYCTNKSIDTVNKKDTSLSSLDNLTNNKTIFDKKTRTILDHISNNSSNKLTLTLDTSRTLKSNLNLLSKRSKDDSFIKSISPLINYQKVILNENNNENKEQNKTTSNPNRNKNEKNIQKNKFSLKSKLIKNNNIKSSLYNLVKNNLNCETIKYNQKKILKSPKLKTYLSNYKSNLEEFNKNKLKYIEKLNNGNDKLKNKTINTNNNNLNSNFRNFSKLSATLNNNLNNHFLFASTIRNNSVTNHQKKNINHNNNNNGSNSKTKNSNKIMPNGNSIHSSGSTIQRSKNITYDVKIFNSMNNLTKFNSNSNFSCFNYNQSTLRTNRKSSYGSNFNLVKTPINEINGSSNSYKNKFSKNKNIHNNGNQNNNNSKNSLIINPSSSIPKYNNKKEQMKNSKDKNHINYKKKNINISQNTINFNNLLFSVQKNKKHNHNLISPNGFQSNRMGINLNICNGSRNKKNILTHTQTNIKTFRKDIISHKTKSLDEEKLKLKNIFFGSKNNYQMSQRLFNQIEELIKKSNAPFLKYNYLNKLNIHKKTINNNHSNSSLHNNYSGCNISIKFNSSKTINVNSMKINNEDKKEKRIRIISPKK